jgi:hypothetical protein
MKKTSVALLSGTAIAALFAASSAFAAQNVANTSQKGSLLIWPKISVDANVDTIVEISNDSNSGIHLYCEYVNEAKGRAPFDLFVSGKGTVSWDVKTQTGDHAQPPPFPTNIGGGPRCLRVSPRTPTAASCCASRPTPPPTSRSRLMN